MPDPNRIIQAEAIGKSFGGVPVLESVTFDICSGEVHTLMGENGAGKSTLMKIIAGVHRPDTGKILFDGREVHFHNPHAAIHAGIALIHQEPLSFPDLTVAENIFLGRGLPRGAIGQIDWKTMYSRASDLLGQLGVNLDPRARMMGLSVADQQMVELAAALSLNARVLLMDEPTAALTPREVDRLFQIVNSLKARGVAIVFISHRLPEVFVVSDRITVLRDGQCIGTRAVAQTTREEIVRMMVGRELNALYEKPDVPIGSVRLKVDGLSSSGKFSSVSFEARAGEIVGIAGLVGAGRTEVAEAIFGMRKRNAGSILVDGAPVQVRSPQDAMYHGIAYVPEDRQHNGLLLPMTIAANTTLAQLDLVSRAGLINARKERTIAEDWKQRLSTRLRDVTQPAQELSGGNQQKVVLSKWLLTDPKVLIVDEPTRGIDVGAKAEVHHVLTDLAREGKAIVMISSDLPEVLAMSDRILVMRAGQIAAEFKRGEATQENIMAAATGTSRSPLGEGQGEGGCERRSGSSLEAPLTPTLSQRERGKNILRFREFGILAFVVLAFIGATLLERRFASVESLRTIMLYSPLFIIIAMGQLMVIVSRNIDLSVGAILGLSAMIAGGIFVDHPNFPVPLAMLAGILVGGFFGAVNGVLIAYLRVPAIIATLGTLTGYRGLIHIYSGGRQIDPDKLPTSLIQLSQTGPLTIPWIVWFAILIAAIAALYLRYTKTGREIFAIGSNPHAAGLRGIPVQRVLLLIFTLTGALCGFAGLLFGSRFGTINPASVGQSMELVVISAVVIGGAAVNGGSGTVLGTVLGCILLGIVNVALTMSRVSEFWQMSLYGAAILAACLLDAFLRRRSAGGAA